MSEAKTYTLLHEPRSADYRGLLLVALRYANLALLVIQDFDHHVAAHPIFSRLKPFTVSETRESSWPGTDLLGGKSAVIIKFKFNEATAQVLSESAEGLYDWISPDLPEDLCLLRQSGEPLLATISHEKDSFLQVSESELRDILASVPNLLVTAG